jgi:transcriptional regulator with XRE-family HTH domain
MSQMAPLWRRKEAECPMPTRKKRIKQAAVIESFAKRLREVRTTGGMTQKDLAAKAKVTLSYVSKLESGGAAPGLDLLERLAQSLGVTIPDLLPKPIEVGVDEQRKALQVRFQSLLSNCGQETIMMLDALVARLSDSPMASR